MTTQNHLIFNYFVYLFLFRSPDPSYFIPFMMSSIVLDLDHVYAFMMAKRKKKRFRGATMRTRLHELSGVVFLSLVVFGLWFWDQDLAFIIGLGLILHFTLDFLSGESRPFYPISKIKTNIFFKKNSKSRIAFEVILTITFIIVFLWRTLKN